MNGHTPDFQFEQVSFDDWLKLTFDDPMLATVRFASLFVPDTPAGAARVIEHCTRLFHDPAFLLDQYELGILEKVFWAMPGIDGYLSCLCCNRVTLSIRIACIHSMFDLFDKLFRLPRAGQLHGPCFMWWENLLSAEWKKGPHINQIGPLVAETLALLERLLHVESEQVQQSALHGLSEFHAEHLKLRIALIVDEYLARNRGIGSELREYALLCRAGQAQ
jgi:hypothetical protein